MSVVFVWRGASAPRFFLKLNGKLRVGVCMVSGVGMAGFDLTPTLFRQGGQALEERGKAPEVIGP